MESRTVRKRAIKKSLDTILQDVLDILEADVEKSIEEKKTSVIAMLDEIIQKSEKNVPAPVGDLDVEAAQFRNIFWSFGKEIPANGILLRYVQEKDREDFLNLRKNYAIMESMFKHEELRDSMWREHTEERSLMLSIEQNGTYVGYCGIQDLTKSVWEISIELMPTRLRQGIGFAALTTMLNELKARLWVNSFRIRIEPTNYASQKLFEKLGAIPNGISELWIHDQEALKQLENENQHLINDDLIAVAKKFSVQPQQLLSHVLEYNLFW